MSATDIAARRITFSAHITPTRMSGAYRIGLLITAVAMLLLPLLYLALIAARRTNDHRLADFGAAFGADLPRLELRHQEWMKEQVERHGPRRP